jgi:uncharacterized protein (TIGR02265 family)
MALPRSLRVHSKSTLTHAVDLEERIRCATESDTLKGMFFQRIVDIGRRTGMAIEHVALDKPPRELRYQAFFDYPVADYFRLVYAVAKKLYPNVSSSEAVRRTGARDFGAFAQSPVGRVMLAFAGSARATLAKSGSMYGAVLKGASKVESESVPEGVRLRYRNYAGLTEVYPIGTIEGCCQHYDAEYEIEIVVISPRDADYLVRLKE